jgi:hypothetical protein
MDCASEPIQKAIGGEIMELSFIRHEKINLKKQSQFNEAWLHDRICDDPSLLGFGDIRVLERERAISGAGRLDVLLFDEDNNTRYEVEIMLGATDPSHIIRTIEYWDAERRRYPGYDHVAVLVAEDITTRFLNVMSLLAGNIPLIAIQLDALRVEEHLVLNFVHVLDQTALRIDDTDDDSDGKEVDRGYWNQKAGPELMGICDEVLNMINGVASTKQDLNLLRGHIGLRSNGVVRNFIYLAPKPMKKFVHLTFSNSNAPHWKELFEEAGVPVANRRDGRLRISITPGEFVQYKDLVRQVVEETVKEAEA